MSNLDILKLNYNNVKNDFKNQYVDPYVALIEIESISKKLMSIIQHEQNLSQTAVNLLYYVNKLKEEIQHEIKRLEKEVLLNSNDHEI